MLLGGVGWVWKPDPFLGVTPIRLPDFDTAYFQVVGIKADVYEPPPRTIRADDFAPVRHACPPLHRNRRPRQTGPAITLYLLHVAAITDGPGPQAGSSYCAALCPGWPRRWSRP